MIKPFALSLGAALLVSACSSQPTAASDAGVNDGDSAAETAPAGTEAQATPAPAETASATDGANGSENAGDTTAAQASTSTAATPVTGKRVVDCKIVSNGTEELAGPCQFSPQANGGFTLTAKSGQGALYGRISSVSVAKIDKTNAEVSGLTSDGINSRWGSATRSTQDPACWTGSDFSVCAY